MNVTLFLGSANHVNIHHKIIHERESTFKSIISNLKYDLKTLQSIHYNVLNDSFHKEKEYSKTIVKLAADIVTIENNHMELMEAFQEQELECNHTIMIMDDQITNMTNMVDSQTENLLSLHHKIDSLSSGVRVISSSMLLYFICTNVLCLHFVF